jgi:hypothetical protein
VTVRRHEVAEALKLRVTQAELMTLFAPAGTFLTAIDLKLDVLEKSSLRVRLPQGARLFNALVNKRKRGRGARGRCVAVSRLRRTPRAAGRRRSGSCTRRQVQVAATSGCWGRA